MAGWARGSQSAVYYEPGKAAKSLEEGLYQHGIFVSICNRGAKDRPPTVNGHYERVE